MSIILIYGPENLRIKIYSEISLIRINVSQASSPALFYLIYVTSNVILHMRAVPL